MQLGDRVGGLLDRHLLQQRHHVHRGHRRAQDRGDALALGLDRADLGQPGGLGGDVEEPADPAGRRRVQHHRVVDPAAVGGAGHRLLDLAGQQHVAHARARSWWRSRSRRASAAPGRPGPACRTCRGTPAAPPRRPRPARTPRRRRRRGARVAGRDRPLLVRQRRPVEDLRDALPLLDLDQQRAPAVGGQGQRQRGGDRGLAGAALAGHHVQPGRPPRVDVVIRVGRHSSRLARAGTGLLEGLHVADPPAAVVDQQQLEPRLGAPARWRWSGSASPRRWPARPSGARSPGRSSSSGATV